MKQNALGIDIGIIRRAKLDNYDTGVTGQIIPLCRYKSLGQNISRRSL